MSTYLKNQTGSLQKSGALRAAEPEDQKLTKQNLLLHGIGMAGYRSFAQWQEMLFDSKVTVIAGINNSGKSNVLKFLQNKLHAFPSGSIYREPETPEEALDTPTGFSAPTTLEIGFPVFEAPARDATLAKFQTRLMEQLARNGVYWSRYIYEPIDGNYIPSLEQINRAIGTWDDWTQDRQDVLDAVGGGVIDDRSTMRSLLSTFTEHHNPPPVLTIEAGRKVGERDSGEVDWTSGRGLIRALGVLQNPPHNEWHTAKPKWESIQNFVQNVTGDAHAVLNIPYDFSTIQVETPDRVLPLRNLGSGLEQLIVLAAAATVTTDTLICIEEPETNLHPLLQKKLIRHLHDHTTNQYVIATHSPHFLDDSRTSAYSVRQTREGSRIASAKLPHELVQICNDLGYRPSDLLQANCVIWVEGPSDRIYIRRWLELVAPELSEGVNYSIMFYGGRLLSHLSADDDSVEDFIELRKLNRLSAVVIDSDSKAPNATLNATKNRIVREFSDDAPAPGIAWVTACNTIENYIQSETLSRAVEDIHPGRTISGDSEWLNPFAKAPGQIAIDKVKVARKVVPELSPGDLDRLDLRERISALADFIRTSNAIQIQPNPPAGPSL